MKAILKQTFAPAMARLGRRFKLAWSIDCRLYFARWIQRLAYFLDNTDPGPLFVVGSSFIIGFTLDFVCAGIGDNHIVLPLHQYVWIGIQITFKYGLTGLILLYGVWEFFQGCKWLNKWAERYQYGKKYTQTKNSD